MHTPFQSILVRHGPTQLNNEGKYLSYSDPPLSKVGQSGAKKKALVLYEKLKTSKAREVLIFTSPSKRALQTARFFEEVFDRAATVVEDLREVDLGVLEGKSKAELSMPSHPQHEEFTAWRDERIMKSPSAGETFEEIADRCALVSGLMDTPWTPNILVTHGIFARCMAAYLCMGGDVKMYRSMLLDVLGHIEISNSEGNYRVAEVSQFSVGTL